jgi:hypothetical protein
MKLDDLNRWMSLAASLGVIAGLVLLAFELQQNREMMRAQTRNDIALGVMDLMYVVASNPQLNSVMLRGSAGEELTPDEYSQFRQMVVARLRYYENVHYQYQQGMYEKPYFDKQKQAWKAAAARMRGAQAIWCEQRHTYAEEFVREFEALVAGIYKKC